MRNSAHDGARLVVGNLTGHKDVGAYAAFDQHCATHPSYADFSPDERQEILNRYGPGTFEPDEAEFPAPRAKGPKSSAPLIEFADDGSLASPSDEDYLIKGLILRGAAGSIVGPSGVGKTTFSLALCFAVANGREFCGLRTKPSPVLYVGYEGLSGLRNRIAAAVRVYGHPGQMFARMLMAPNLNKTLLGAEGVKLIAAAARELERNAGQPVGLIVIDTKARATAGDDEDKATDAASFAEHRVARLTQLTGAAIGAVHHTGKDPAKGARGSSADSAAHDWRLLIDTACNVTVDKSRDGRDGYTMLTYRLKPIVLRIDGDGDAVTACVIESTTVAKAREKLSPSELEVVTEIDHLVLSGNSQMAQGEDCIPDGVKVVTIADLRDAWARKHGADNWAAQTKNKRAGFGTFLERCRHKGWLGVHDEKVWKIR